MSNHFFPANVYSFDVSESPIPTSWSPRAPMNDPRQHFAVTTHGNDTIFAFCGIRYGVKIDDIEVYDADNDQWKDLEGNDECRMFVYKVIRL